MDVAELRVDLWRVARLRQPGDVGRRRRERPDGRRKGAWRGVIGDAQADRRQPGGQDAGQRNVRPLRHDDREPARPAGSAPAPSAAGVMTPISGAWSALSRSNMIPLSGGRRLISNRRSTPPWVVERDADPVDRVGREGDHAAATQGLDRGRPAIGTVGDDRGGHAGSRCVRRLERGVASGLRARRRRGIVEGALPDPAASGRRCPSSCLGAARRLPPPCDGMRRAPRQVERARAPRSSGRRPRPQGAARCSGRPPGLRRAHWASPRHDRPRRASRNRSTGPRSRGSPRAGPGDAARAIERRGLSRRPAPRTRGTSGWLIVTSATPANRSLASGASSVGRGGTPTASTLVTGCWIEPARSRHELGPRAHERAVVVRVRVVGAEDEPLEVVDVGVETVLRGPRHDLAGDCAPGSACA